MDIKDPKKRRKIIRDKRQYASFARLQKFLFFGTLTGVFILSLIFPLRPKVSNIEKRELTRFPSVTISSFLDGSFQNQLSTWFADTFPFREGLISLNSNFKSLYGKNSVKIVKKTARPNVETKEVAKETKKADPVEEEKLPDGTITVIPETAGDVYVTEDRAFSLFYFTEKASKAYSDMINKAKTKLGDVNVYSLVVPTSSGVNLDDKVVKDLGASSQKDAIKDLYGRIKEGVTTIDAFTSLKAHNSEYLYFRTDHHWTQLGARYAFEAFAKEKGFTPSPLSAYKKMEIPGFIGTFYASSNQDPGLKKNPDTVEAYIPRSTNDMKYIGKNGKVSDWKIVFDVTGWNPASLYNAFIAGDNPLAIIDNPEKNDDENIVVIKESYGNAFIPFLTDHYDKVFVVDFRYFRSYKKYNNDLVRFIKENKVKDVLFINNTEAAFNVGVSNSIENMFK